MMVSTRWSVLLLTVLATAASVGQENAPPRPAPAPPAEAEAEPEAPPPAERPERPDVADDEFIPTEELAPDAAVTFPVDI
jgi:hypothetical protein